MDRDDEQILRHQTREMATFLSIFYEELREAGLPRKLSERITLGQWMQLQTNGQVEELAAQLAKGIIDDITKDSDEEEE